MLAFSLPGTSDDPPFFQDFNLADTFGALVCMTDWTGETLEIASLRFPVMELVNSSTSEPIGRFNWLWIVGCKSLLL